MALHSRGPRSLVPMPSVPISGCSRCHSRRADWSSQGRHCFRQLPQSSEKLSLPRQRQSGEEFRQGWVNPALGGRVEGESERFDHAVLRYAEESCYLFRLLHLRDAPSGLPTRIRRCFNTDALRDVGLRPSFSLPGFPQQASETRTHRLGTVARNFSKIVYVLLTTDTRIDRVRTRYEETTVQPTETPGWAQPDSCSLGRNRSSCVTRRGSSEPGDRDGAHGEIPAVWCTSKSDV